MAGTSWALRTRVAGVVAALSLVLGISACYRVRSQLIASPAPPDGLYRCLQLELGKAGYTIVGADRASGWLQAQKRIHTFWQKELAEIYATVIPDEDGRGSHLQLTDNSYAETDAEKLRSACAS